VCMCVCVCVCAQLNDDMKKSSQIHLVGNKPLRDVHLALGLLCVGRRQQHINKKRAAKAHNLIELALFGV